MRTLSCFVLLALVPALDACSAAPTTSGGAKIDLDDPAFGGEDRAEDRFTRRLEIQGTLGFGETRSGTFSTTGYAGWIFTGGAGAALAATLTGYDTDPVLYLYGPVSGSGSWGTATPIARNDDAGGTLNSRISGRLRRAGTYLLLAREYWGRAGRFDLALACAGAECRTECGAEDVCPAGAACQRIYCITTPCPSYCAPIDPTLACETDDDCTKIPAGCCSCSMGGRDRAVNTDYAEALLPECGPEPIACPAVYLCRGEEAACVDNQCKLVFDDPPIVTLDRSCGSRGLPPCYDGEYCDYPETAGCGWADGAGTCRTMPTACTREFEPVCGCDRTTYANRCNANAAGVSVQHMGPCAAVDDCHVGGCSGQLCIGPDDPGFSTCEWRDEYACYRDATCERQAGGECGWTETISLLSCLDA